MARRRLEVFEVPPLPQEVEQAVQANGRYRSVLYTDGSPGGGAVQQVAMLISPQTMGAAHVGERPSVGWERHVDTTQYFKVVRGSGWLLRSQYPERAEAQRVAIKTGDAITIPAGWFHDLETEDELALYTLYFPPHHPPGTADETRTAAEARELVIATLTK